MNQFWSICIFLCGTYTASAQEHIADSLAQRGDYELAAVYYEKAIFEDTASRSNYLLLKKSAVYKEAQAYEKALAAIQRVRLGGDEALDIQLVRQSILLHYLIGNYQDAYNELLKYRLLFDEASTNLIIIEALTLAKLTRWKESKSLLHSHAYRLGVSEEAINSCFPEKLSVKDPDKAYTLSLFLPGIGQMYAGYFFKGLFSGFIQTGLVAFSGYSILNGYFFTGGMTGVALFYTFYFGGARYARQLANKKNRSVTEEITQQISNQLIKEKALREGF